MRLAAARYVRCHAAGKTTRSTPASHFRRSLSPYYVVSPYLKTEERHWLEFVYTPVFLASARGLLEDEALRQIELTLLLAPRAGAVVPGAGGIRKLRAALRGRGKRGGAREIYLYVEVRGTIYFLLAYGRSEQVDLTPAEKKALRAMARKLEEGDDPQEAGAARHLVGREYGRGRRH